jgi:hypothetical protein
MSCPDDGLETFEMVDSVPRGRSDSGHGANELAPSTIWRDAFMMCSSRMLAEALYLSDDE